MFYQEAGHRTGRLKTPLMLSLGRDTLDSLAHWSRTAPQLALRMRIVLVCANGLKVVAKKRRITR